MSKQEKINQSIEILMETIESNSELKQRLIDQDVYSTDSEFYKDGHNLSITLSTIQSMICELRAETKHLNGLIKETQEIIEGNKIKIQKLLN